MRVGHARLATYSGHHLARSTMCKVVPRVDLPLVSESSSSIRHRHWSSSSTASTLLCPSMAFWSARGVRNNIFICARFIMMLVHGSPYTRSKLSNNHRLYCDTMPLTLYRQANFC